ncbi:sigma-70 family RNA polymerase sigma factor [Blastococcus saxobsidens]|uniref:Sigma-70 family RNA polymerase sigma factor n=1 Tax=Blastococcus saxobsidens TaxID=138336 RepID=A0A6L9W4U9_9ACTN|nr:sigma-70 family RNA polymerase sigma factor [Blastococcus saxobsidens]NEK87136.1 sigma-70 family RNA polymerase sigma factor [Blastococcus saxobsidens]
MPHPLDAGRPTGPPAPPRARPTPFPRTSAEALPPNEPTADEVTADAENADGAAAELPAEVAEELAVAEEFAAAEATTTTDGVDVWELVRQAQAGDAEAFGRLYDHYVSLVHRYVYHRVGDRATAEDVTSETFVRALRRIDSLSFQGRDVGAWLVTIARNIIRDQVKSSRFRLEISTADMRDADRVTEGPEDAVLQHLTNQQLLACVQQLGSEQQECIVLRFLHGLSVSETAEIMGKKDGAIKALQHRAVRRLAGLLPEGLR